MSDTPLDCWNVDMGESTVKLDEEEVREIFRALEGRTVVVTDIYGCETHIVLDKIMQVARYSIAANIAASKRNRAYDNAIKEGEEEWHDG